MSQDKEAKGIQSASEINLWKLIKGSCTDEDGEISSPRVKTMLLTLVGVVSIFIGFLFLYLKVPGTSGYLTIVLGICFGTSAAASMSAQAKSAQVKIEKMKTAPSSSTTPPASPPANPLQIPQTITGKIPVVTGIPVDPKDNKTPVNPPTGAGFKPQPKEEKKPTTETKKIAGDAP